MSSPFSPQLFFYKRVAPFIQQTPRPFGFFVLSVIEQQGDVFGQQFAQVRSTDTHLFRRMLIGISQQFAQVHHANSIQIQCRHRSPPRQRQPDDLGEVFIPCEMFLPAMITRMKKADTFSRERVNDAHSIILFAIAPMTGVSQIAEDGLTAFGFGPLDFEMMWSTEKGSEEKESGQRQYSQ